MNLTRRSFLRYCSLSAGTLGLCQTRLGFLREALANPTAPSVLWLIGSACTGCSVSFLNRISDKAGEPPTVAEVLTQAVNLVFHPTIMGGTGDTAAAALQQVYRRGNYILVLEGAVPTAFGGNACVVYTLNGVQTTYQQAALELASRTDKIVCVGTCASFGGIPAAGSNPTKAMSAPQLIGKTTLNISGCPANPDWAVWAIVQLLLGARPTLDADGRPVALYSTSHTGAPEAPIIHDKCPRNPSNGTPMANSFGEDGHCLQNLGCRGPYTKSRCNASWNGIAGRTGAQPHPAHWCIGKNAPCHGCVEKTFPGPYSFSEPYLPE
jgi:hydrogenase small subunit